MLAVRMYILATHQQYIYTHIVYTLSCVVNVPMVCFDRKNDVRDLLEFVCLLK